jgi:Uri superfamily endonuclease
MTIIDIASQVCSSLEGFYGSDVIDNHNYIVLINAIGSKDEATIVRELPEAMDVLRNFGCEDVDALQSMFNIETN